MIVELSDSENPSSGAGKKKTTTSASADTRTRRLTRSKIAELDTLKKSIVSLFTLPQKFEEKSLTLFLKSKLRIKESFISKNLDSMRQNIVKALDPKNSHYDPTVGEMHIDFLLSIYVSIQKNMNRIEGDDTSSIYNLPEAKKELVEKNTAKDEIIKKRIQDIIIDSVAVSAQGDAKISSYSFVKSLLNAFDQFMRSGNNSINDDQMEKILEYLISLLDYEEPEQPDMEVEESKSSARSRQSEVVSNVPKEEEKKSAKTPSKSKDTRSRPISSKSERDVKGKSDKEVDAKKKEDTPDDINLAIPAILNFISGYFLSRTPQDLDLSEYRKKRIERRKKLEEKKNKEQSGHKETTIGGDDLKEEKAEDAIDGFNKKEFVKEETLKDASGNTTLCTFTKTKRNYQNQPWYMCYTCGLSGNEGVCSVCVKTCHKGHETAFVKISSFFCDCQFKFKCISLPDEYKESGQKQRDGFGFESFNYDNSPFSSDPAWKFGRGGFRGAPRGGRGDYGGGLFSRGRGRPDRGGYGGRYKDREQFDVLRKSKKRAAKAHKIKNEAKGFVSHWPRPEEPPMFEDPGFLRKLGRKPGAENDVNLLQKKMIESSDSEDSSDGIGGNSSSPNSSIARKFLGDEAPEEMYGGKCIPVQFSVEEEEIIIDDEFLENDAILEQLREEALMSGGTDIKKIQMLEEMIAAKRAEASAKGRAPRRPDDEGEGEGEGEEDEEEGEEEEDEIIEEEKKEFIDEEEFKEPDEASLAGIEEDKKMEEIDEDSKSISSVDVKMGKETPPKLEDEAKELNIIEEQNEQDREEDIVMEEENEDFLNEYNRTHELFAKSDKKNMVPKKLLDRFQSLIKRIKRRVAKSATASDHKASGGNNIEKIMRNLVEPEKKMITNNNATTAKRSMNAGTIKMSSKAGDDGSSNLLIGLPGQTNYQIPKNCFASNSVGILAVAEGDVVSIVDTNNQNSLLTDASAQNSNPGQSQLNIVLKSVGIGFAITQMKFHPNNDNFLAVYGNKECIIIVLDKSSSSAGIKVTQTIKLDLMLDQLGPDLSIVDCCWLPQCSTHLAVLTKMFLKVYDLSKDILSPAFCINEIQDASGLNYMTSMTIANVSGSTTAQRIFVGTQSGAIYTHLLDNQEALSEHDALYFVEEVKINTDISEISNSSTKAVVALYYSNLTDLLYISYEC